MRRVPSTLPCESSDEVPLSHLERIVNRRVRRIPSTSACESSDEVPLSYMPRRVERRPQSAAPPEDAPELEALNEVLETMKRRLAKGHRIGRGEVADLQAAHEELGASYPGRFLVTGAVTSGMQRRLAEDLAISADEVKDLEEALKALDKPLAATPPPACEECVKRRLECTFVPGAKNCEGCRVNHTRCSVGGGGDLVAISCQSPPCEACIRRGQNNCEMASGAKSCQNCRKHHTRCSLGTVSTSLAASQDDVRGGLPMSAPAVRVWTMIHS